MRIIKDFDYATIINVRADAFIHNYSLFEKYIYNLFDKIYPNLMNEFENGLINRTLNVEN